ncbi:activator of basal transcription 1-like [Macrobrachium nipponense]|uniref:activator of basal transcription 1-like n=1 Tax=Macrobrachium nipponense TaxID=159736 RepID=UPI0030C7CB02
MEDIVTEKDTTSATDKKRKPGIIYLSTIPTGFHPTKIRSYFTEFGEVGRMFLQTSNDDKTKSSSKKSQQYTEGWIEFKSKRKAKWVTMMLNSNKVGGKKKDACYDELWNIKYLPRFKWAFLHQRLEYERESYRQRMNAAISQVRQETDHFVKVSETSEKKRKKEKKEKLKDKTTEKPGESVDAAVPANTVDIKSGFVFKQRNTDSEIVKKKDKKQKDAIFKKRIAKRKKLKEKRKLEKLKNKKPDEDFLGSVFVGSSQ